MRPSVQLSVCGEEGQHLRPVEATALLHLLGNADRRRPGTRVHQNSGSLSLDMNGILVLQNINASLSGAIGEACIAAVQSMIRGTHATFAAQVFVAH